ncbi:MAG: M67 family metallopeptidase [Candidatus Omnitrophota bacterium]
MLQITQNAFHKMTRDAQARLPNEGCGFLAGPGEVATTFYSIANTEQSPTRYLMDPKGQLEAIKKMRARGEKMLGIYHSHVVTAACPSFSDISLANYPEAHYVIVSLAEGEEPIVRAFRIERGKVREEPFAVISPSSTAADSVIK